MIPEPNSNKNRKHFRSSSCDIKIIRTNSKEYDNNEYKLKKYPRSHSRNNSRDLGEEFRQKLTHSRNNSRDDQHANIKYIINHLKSTVKETGQLNKINSSCELIDKKSMKNHTRNNSFDQQELNNKNHSRFGSKDDVNILKNLDNKFPIKNSSNEILIDDFVEPKYTHSRTNSKELNAISLDKPLVLTSDDSSNILRHRRTNSKDLKQQYSLDGVGKGKLIPIVASLAIGGGVAIATTSQHKLHNDQEELETAQLLLRPISQSEDNIIIENELIDSLSPKAFV